MTSHSALPVRRWPVLLCLGLILVYPLFSVPVQGSIYHLAPRFGTISARVITEAAIWLYAGIVVAIALLWEKRTLASIGLRKLTFASLGWALAGAAGMLVAGQLAAYVAYSLLRQPLHADSQAAALVDGSVVYALCLATRAGVIEEIFYRGLAIEQLTFLTGSRWFSAFLATAVFVVIHLLHFDAIQLIPIAAVALVLTGLYLWRRNLWANMIAHVMVDSIGLVTLALRTHKLAH